MKKSTLLYLGLHAFIFLIPLAFVLALRAKIAAGDIIDIQAQVAARYKSASFGDIHEIEVTGSSDKLKLTLNIFVLDSVNTIGMDTSTAKYVTYSISGDKLTVQYDHKKDSVDNIRTKEQIEREAQYEYMEAEDHEYRTVTVYVKSNLTKIKSDKSIVSLDLDNNEKLLNDLEVQCSRSTFNLAAPYITEQIIDEFGETQKKVILYDFKHHLTLQLRDNSEGRITNFGSIQKFDLELKGRSKINEYVRTDEFNLTIDKASTFMMDVNDLDQVKIKYE